MVGLSTAAWVHLLLGAGHRNGNDGLGRRSRPEGAAPGVSCAAQSVSNSPTILPTGSGRLQRTEPIDVDQGYRSHTLLGFIEIATGMTMNEFAVIDNTDQKTSR